MQGRKQLHLPQYYSTLNQINHKREHEHHYGYLIEEVSTGNKKENQINVKKVTKNSTKSKEDQMLLLQVTEAPLTNVEGGL